MITNSVKGSIPYSFDAPEQRATEDNRIRTEYQYYTYLNRLIRTAEANGTECRPRQDRLAEIFGVTEKTIYRWSLKLQQFGYLDWHPTDDGSVYFLPVMNTSRVAKNVPERTKMSDGNVSLSQVGTKMSDGYKESSKNLPIDLIPKDKPTASRNVIASKYISENHAAGNISSADVCMKDITNVSRDSAMSSVCEAHLVHSEALKAQGALHSAGGLEANASSAHRVPPSHTVCDVRLIPENLMMLTDAEILDLETRARDLLRKHSVRLGIAYVDSEHAFYEDIIGEIADGIFMDGALTPIVNYYLRR